jgi:sugar/nucleoside kinase (ribokinase family)
VLLSVGDLLEDVVVWLPGPVALGSDTLVRTSRQRGGSAANVAAAAARAGGRSRFVGQVGDDDLAQRLLHRLASTGVDVVVRHGGRTGSIVVLVDDTGERTMLTDRAAATELDGADPAWLDGVEVLHLPAYSLFVERLGRSCRDLAAMATERGIPVSVDPSSTALLEDYGIDRFLDLLAGLQPAVLFPNGAEAALLPGGGVPEGVGLMVEKHGAEPVRLVDADGVTEVPVPPVDGVVDTTGAGDAFAAGFLVAWTAGKPPVEAVARGNEVAAHVLRGPGGDAWVAVPRGIAP